MNKVVHFELPADDFERAKKFYETVFRWQLKDEPEMDYVTAITVEMGDDHKPKVAGAINGGLAKRDGIVKQPSFALEVDDIDAALEKVKQAGGTVEREKMSLEGMGYLAYFRDTEGNLLSLWQNP